MTVPTYDHFIEPLLRYLAAHSDGATIANVYEGGTCWRASAARRQSSSRGSSWNCFTPWDTARAVPALQRVGGSGDGGIDGIISLDRLGLEKVYIQAKRWKSTNVVGSPEIQGFMGALQLQSASKGVFITTSSFTKDAKQAAAKARGNIVLVDGEQLSTLMMDHGVGVSHKALQVPKVDSDYFEED